jgi:hypothetical protein
MGATFLVCFKILKPNIYNLVFFTGKKKMQGALRTCLTHGNVVKDSLLQHVRVLSPLLRPIVFSRFESVSSARIEEHGFESTRIADILKEKGKGADGSWLWCTTDDTVYDAVKSVSIFTSVLAIVLVVIIIIIS